MTKPTRFEEEVLEKFLSALQLADENEGNADVEVGTMLAKEISQLTLEEAAKAVGKDIRVERFSSLGSRRREQLTINKVKREIRTNLKSAFGEGKKEL